LTTLRLVASQVAATNPAGVNHVVVRERMWDCLAELIPLHRQHWEEVDASWRPDTVFAPDYDAYLRRERAGRLHLLTLRTAVPDAELVGYFKLSVDPDPHERGRLICDDEGLYVLPMHRSYRNLKMLLDAGEALARGLGAGVLRLTSSAAKADGLAKVMVRRGFEPVRVAFGKVL
jgi:GNAT superfamily N-acetyltransferase